VAHFYIDEDVAVEVGALLQREGHTAPTTRDLGLTGAHDGLQLLTAAQRHAVLVTHNGRHLRLLHQAWQCWTVAWQVQHQQAGILVLPHGPAVQSLQRLLDFLQLNWPTVNMVYRYQAPRGWEPY
jgi:hypothetical protein